MSQVRKEIIASQVEREYKTVLQHIKVAKTREKTEVFVKLPDLVAAQVAKKLQDDRYSVVVINGPGSDGLHQILWAQVPKPVPVGELRAQAAAKLTPEEREAVGIDEKGVYTFCIPKYKVRVIHRDSWNGPEEGQPLYFDSEGAARMHIRERTKGRSVTGPVPESYTNYEYVGVVAFNPQTNKEVG